MTHPDLQDIPTLDDLVFPGEYSLKSNDTPKREPSVTNSAADITTHAHSEPIAITETVQKNKQQAPHIHVDESLSYKYNLSDDEVCLQPSFGTEQSASPHQGLPNNDELPTDFIPHRQDPIFQLSTEKLSAFHRHEPSFGPIVSIHSLATEEAGINLGTPTLLASPPGQDTREEPHFPNGMNEESLMPVNQTLDSPTSRRNKPIARDEESFEALVAAAVRRAIEEEKPQLTQRIIDRLLLELGQARR